METLKSRAGMGYGDLMAKLVQAVAHVLTIKDVVELHV